MKKTPLFNVHLQLKARMVPFAGYEMPVQYTSVIQETLAVRSVGGVFDVSHMGQFSLSGKGGLENLDRLVTNDLAKLKIGQAQYNILCAPDGGAIDDLVVYRRDEQRAYICVNAANREKDFGWLREHLPQSLSLEDESEDTALIAVQGPQAAAVVKQLGGAIDSLKYYWAAEVPLAGEMVYLSRTGYTGEDGFEIYVRNQAAEKIWNALFEAAKVLGTPLIPAGLGARDTLRTEMGYALYGHELSAERNPISAGLRWVVKLNKADFIGKHALASIVGTGPDYQLRALVIHDKRMAREGYRVLDAHADAIGFVTSGVFSPHLNSPIALAFLKPGFDSPQKCRVEIRQSTVDAEIVPLPFVKRSTQS
ncbi:MAG: glycine cleavage system aminomethyltransferase GcvT [Bdellovibrionales bacterium]|nr:glycine cleavage system aminomethyltransferase GcvT [Bdellovibrionales bacterium]